MTGSAEAAICPNHEGIRSMLYLSRGDVRNLFPPLQEQLDIVENTYRALAAGLIELPPKPGIHPRPDAFIHAMPAYLREEDVAAVKWISGYPQNKRLGLPYISGLMIMNDPSSGIPIAVMDAAEITVKRTAAASGVCIRKWAPRGWRGAAILGCGEQGRAHAAVLRSLKDDVEISAYDPDPQQAATLPGSAVAPVDTWEGAVKAAEVIVTAGPIVEHPQSPLTLRRLRQDRWLALPIDFDFYVASDTVAAADLFLVDDVAQYEYYRSLGHFRGWRAPDGSVGEYLMTDAEAQTVVCCNLGVGALDAALAKRIIDAAHEAGAGTVLSL